MVVTLHLLTGGFWDGHLVRLLENVTQQRILWTSGAELLPGILQGPGTPGELPEASSGVELQLLNRISFSDGPKSAHRARNEPRINASPRKKRSRADLNREVRPLAG